MKKLLIILCLIFSTVIIARTDVDLSSFNKQMLENIDEVIEDNPEVYEKTNPGRLPASSSPIEKVNPTNKLDHIEEQADGQKSW